ncbi:MAG TPA: phytanoyl-CoA dioxygenase family protein [Ktedonobacteraceae bacterium]|nr:phytanoyl-CoA dioxygenase family protein [Ktedonobacteraceae bacterium]
MTTTSSIEPILTEAEVAQFHEQGYLLIKGVLTRDEAMYYRNHILDLIPRDLNIPTHWGVHDGRIKPMNEGDNQTFDTPELLPLLINERLYKVAVQLLGSTRLRSSDGSLGVTLRNAPYASTLSQRIHLDASVPSTLDNFLFTPAEVQVGGCYYFGDVESQGGGIHVVPGGHRLVEEKARGQAQGRQLYEKWKNITDFPETVEVTGEAGDFAILHHLMPHAASNNRQPMPRVAQFTRFMREDQPHYPARPAAPDRYNQAQLRVMTPLGRKLLGVDPW